MELKLAYPPRFSYERILVVSALKAGCLNVLEKRRSGRQSGRVEKCAVEHPVANRRIINRVTTFECTVVVM